jgi:hypothetical protein
MTGAIVALLGAQLSFGGPLAAWPIVVPIDFTPRDQAQFVRFTVEPQADVVPGLRVVDETGTEVAYVVDPDRHRIGTPPPPPNPDVERTAKAQPQPASAGAQSQIWTFDLGDTVPSDGVSFSSPSLTAGHTVNVEASPDAKLWHSVAVGRIVRATFAFPEEDDRYWRVTLDVPPVKDATAAAPVLLVRPHDLLFEAQPGHTYALLTGNTSAPGPDYDLAGRLERQDWSAADAKLGAVQTNGAYLESRPIFERFPWLGNAVLIAAALVIVALGYRVTRRPRPPDPLQPGPA